MFDYQTILTLSTVPRFFTVVAKASGNPITTGTVNYYLKALSGTNSGKWYRNSDATWQVTETANAMTHIADGHWSISLDSPTPFADGVVFCEYAKESGDLHIPNARIIKAAYTPSADSDGRADVSKLAGQTVTASAGVTFPSSIGTSTYAGADTSGTTTLLSRIGGAITVSSGKVAATVGTGDLADISATRAAKIDNLDATITSRSTLTAAGVWDYLTSAATTAGSIGKRLVDFVTTLVYAPAPTAADIRAEIDANSTQLAAIVADTGTDIPASIAALHNFDPANDVVAHVTLVDTTTDLTNGGGGGGGGSGNGARIISVTVNDGNGTNLENATVRFTEGANTFTATTDADGYAEFGLDDATYRLSITKAGYSFTPAQVVVSQSADLTRSMTAIVITPAASNQTNAYGYTKSGGGDIQAGVVVSFKMQKTPTTSTSSIFNGSEFTATSDANGLVQVALQQSSVYAYRRGSGAWKTLITTTASTTALGDIIGHDD